MKFIHLANTDFEHEISLPAIDNASIETIWNRFPVCMQLQFLPLLYAEEEDAIAVTHEPDREFIERFSTSDWRRGKKMPAFIPLSVPDIFRSYDGCLSWGASERIRKWAFSHGLPYSAPFREVVKTINSKSFSFTEAPKLPGACLLDNESRLSAWFHATAGPRVIKTCFGMSGKGHYFIDDETDFIRTVSFCAKEWRLGRPLIGEPWMDRVLDFSTQWYLDPVKGVEFVGSAVFENNVKGVYEATLIGSDEQIFKGYSRFLSLHKAIAFPILEKIIALGYFGPLGIDAFIYRMPEGLFLQPIVEINGRQTMSSVALRFRKKYFSDRTLKFSYTRTSSENTLLPTRLSGPNGKEVLFNRNLIFSFHE